MRLVEDRPATVEIDYYRRGQQQAKPGRDPAVEYETADQ